jgi:hypothetical protein
LILIDSTLTVSFRNGRIGFADTVIATIACRLSHLSGSSECSGCFTAISLNQFVCHIVYLS